MLDAKMELDRLRRYLGSRDYSHSMIDELVGYAESEISEAMSDIVQMGLQEAIEAGDEVDADNFVAELRAINMGSTFMIATDSGKTDFSEPPFPMLPNLLKNAKTAEDGSRYKVIPIEKKDVSAPQTKMSNTTLEALVALDQARVESAKGRQARRHGARSGTRSVFAQAADLAGYYALSRPSKPEPKRKEAVKKGVAVDFRTVTSKQDPMQDWVIPEKKRDLTGALRKVNADMQNKISLAVSQIISKYEEMY